MTKSVYLFSRDKTEGSKNMKNLLGGKGANLAEMCSLKIPVPPGMTVTTESCLEFYKNNKTLSETLKNEVLSSIKEIESLTKKRLVKETLLFFFLCAQEQGVPCRE